MQKLKQSYNIPSLIDHDTTTLATSTNLPSTTQITNTDDMMAVVDVETDLTLLNEGIVAVSTSAIQTTTTTSGAGGGGGRIRKKQRIDTEYDTTSHIPYTTDNTTSIQYDNIQIYSINEIFLPAGLIHTNEWTPNSSNLQPLIINLPNFGYESKNQTLG